MWDKTMIVTHSNRSFTQEYKIFGTYTKPRIKFIGLEHENYFPLPLEVKKKIDWELYGKKIERLNQSIRWREALLALTLLKKGSINDSG